jgi:hypothetical protein
MTIRDSLAHKGQSEVKADISKVIPTSISDLPYHLTKASRQLGWLRDARVVSQDSLHA